MAGTKLTKTVIKDVCERLLIGNFPKVAMESLGFNVRNYHYWRKRGEDELAARDAGEPANRRENKYIEFFLETQRANAEAEHLSVVNIRTIATDSKTDKRTRLEAEKFYLQSRHRDRWGAHISQEISGRLEYEVIIGEPAKLAVAVELDSDDDDIDDAAYDIDNDTADDATDDE